jgi:hypothetical protein
MIIHRRAFFAAFVAVSSAFPHASTAQGGRAAGEAQGGRALREPIQNIRATAEILYVVKAGTLYDGTSLDQLCPKTVPFGPNYWVNDDMLQVNTKKVDAHDKRRQP